MTDIKMVTCVGWDRRLYTRRWRWNRKVQRVWQLQWSWNFSWKCICFPDYVHFLLILLSTILAMSANGIISVFWC